MRNSGEKDPSSHPAGIPRGRGAGRRVVGRFEPTTLELDADVALDLGEEPGPEPARTELRPTQARSLIRSNDSPDIPFERSINPYQGCEHGCSYCFARPTHSYLNLSPGLDFETKIFWKQNSEELLRKELRKKGYRCTPITVGANTDPYQPAERNLRLTRRMLEVLHEFRHPLSIITKSSTVLQDLDLLKEMAEARRVAVYLSVTTLDPQLASALEPRASTPARRIDAVRQLAEAGVPVGVLASPMIPGLNDAELDSILSAAAEAGATVASTLLLRLPFELKELFEDWLRTHTPTKADKVLHFLQSMRGGRLNDPRFGHRMRGEGPMADLLLQRFRIACRRFGLNQTRFELDTTGFQPPPQAGDQRALF